MSPQVAPPAGLPQDTPSEAKRIELLQQDVIQAIERTVNLVRKFEALEQSSSNEKAESRLPEVESALKNVKELSLRMAVVAPMKAGKSTIINAIVGQEILPNRNTAMTALPTEIILGDSYQEPILQISDNTLRVFHDSIRQVQDAVKSDAKKRDEVSNQYPHLNETLVKLMLHPQDIFSAETRGCENINKALQPINDLVRICSVVAPEANPIHSIVDIPQIFASPCNLQANDQQLSESVGNLIIIDTPGPNEAGEDLKIKQVFQEQLRNSSIVLLVLDFTQLNTEASAKVADVVKEIADIRGGRESIYAVVNKIDQRRKGDMQPQDVREFVQKEFELEASHVFEVAARHAFIAINFKEEQSKDSQKEVQQMKSTKELAKEIWPLDWEDEMTKEDEEKLLKRLTKKELIEGSNKLLKRSKFVEFTNGVIGELMIIAAPKAIESSLQVANFHLDRIKDAVNLRSKSVNQEAEKLSKQIKALERDLDQLNLEIANLDTISKYKKILNNILNSQLEDLKKSSVTSLDKLFKDEEYNQADLPQRVFLNFRNIVTKFDILNILNKKHDGTIEFYSSEQASNFQEKIITLISDRAEVRLSLVRAEIEKKTANANKDLMDDLKRKVLPILNAARNRLSEEFNIELSLSKVSLKKLETLNIKATPEAKTEKKVIGYERRFYTLFIYLET